MGKNISFVPENNLCTGCGFCSSICKLHCISIRIDKTKGLFYPNVNERICNSCNSCLNICPGINADFNHSVPESWLSLPFNPYIGYYSAIYLGFSNNKEIQFNGSSGGMVTAFLLYLLENNLIDGAIVTGMSKADPLKAEALIARTSQEIIEAQKSKYCPVSFERVLQELHGKNGRYAMVGLPCHISAMRELLKYNEDLSNKILFLIGLFCSRTPSFNATLHLLRKRGIAPNEVSSLQYRGEGHPGFMTVQLKDGKIIKIPHLDYDYWGYMFYKFFIPPRCYLCPDKLAYLADISMGDNWSNLLKYPGGSSTLVIRSPLCLSILKEMGENNLITLKDVGINTLIKSQDLENKCKITPRLKLWRFIGRASPDYGKLEMLEENNTFVDVLNALPQFLRFILTLRQRNFTILRILTRTFWIFDRVNQVLAMAIHEIFTISKSLIPVRSPRLLKKAKFKVIMMGGFGAHDIGDEAMPHADRLNLREYLGNELEIVMFSPDPDFTQKFHNEFAIKDIDELSPLFEKGIKYKLITFRALMRSIVFILGVYLYKYNVSLHLWPSARKVLENIASCDLIFNVGGGNLNSLIPQELYKKGIIYLVARLFNKPVIISGQTIGPFTRKMDKLFARFCLNKVNMITFRDKEVSRNRLLDIGVSKPIMIDAADDAMTIPAMDRTSAANVFEREVGKNWLKIYSPLIVAMNLKGSLKIFKKAGRSSPINKEIELMATIADKIIEKFYAKIVFIPTDYYPGVDDREIHTAVKSKMYNKEYVRSVEGEYDDTTIKGLIGLFDLAVGARYHFCVFAASMYVPFLGIASGIYQQTKLKGLADLFQLPQCFIKEDLEFSDFRDIWPNIETFIEERMIIRQKLKDMAPFLKEKSLCGVKEAVRILTTREK